MFQPETEDMLPRMAPKPMGMSEAVIRPQVPEVSILLGQQEAKRSGNEVTPPQQPPTKVGQQSYAAWKKQMLPRVTFPPEAAGDIAGGLATVPMAPRSNVYPLRTVAAAAAPPLMVTSNVASSAGVAAPNYVGSAGSGGVDGLQYRRSLESAPVEVVYIADNPLYQQLPQQQQQHQKRSLDPSAQCTPPPLRPAAINDVLTICAGTQTDATTSPTRNHVGSNEAFIRNLASKRDVQQLLQMVQEMRAEQMELKEICKALVGRLVGHQSTKESTAAMREVGTQVEASANDPSKCVVSPLQEFVKDNVAEEQRPKAPTNKFLNHLKSGQAILQTPRVPPMAQSTAYRSNSPHSNRLQEQTPPGQHAANIATVLPKPATEKTLVMNELALKYLPNEKLAELLQDLQMSSQPQIAETIAPCTPLRNIENIEKSPADLSNASYKYLKKYRLLPEDEVASDKGCVEYQEVETAKSPFNQVTRFPSAETENMLDLDHIRHQPKFL